MLEEHTNQIQIITEMASTYNRKKEGRKTQVLVLEHVASQAELIEAEAAEAEAREKQMQEEDDRENEEYVKEFEQEQHQELMEIKAKELYDGVMGEQTPCLACHCNHGPDCPLDDEVRRHNQSQEVYLNDPYWSNPW